MDISYNYKQFKKTLFNFISDLNRYSPTDGLNKVIQMYDKLDINLVIKRFHGVMNQYKDDVKKKDAGIFSNEVNVLPGVELKGIWEKLSVGQKNKVWIYLNVLLSISELILSVESNNNNNNNNNIKTINSPNIPNTEEFNPYEGVGANDDNYDVNDLYKPSKLDKEQTSGSATGISAIASMTGLDKMINMDELSEQLANMKDEDILSATDNIKGLLGSNVDSKTTDTITNMLSNITSELKNTDLKSGNALENIVKIAENVASKMGPSIDNNDFDINGLLNSTQNIANMTKDYKNEKGESMFKDGLNPFDLINKVMNNGSGSPVDENEYVNKCKDILGNMGLDNTNLDNLNPDAIKELYNKMNNNNNNK